MSLSHLLPRYSADWRTFTLLALLTAGFLWRWLGGPAWLLFPLSVLCLTACVAKHNHGHCRTFRSRVMNRLLDFWLTFLTGTSASSIRVAHQVRHHGRNQSPDDLVRASLVQGQSALQALLRYVPRVIRESWHWNARDLSESRRSNLWQAQRQERWLLWAFLAVGLLYSPSRFICTFPLPWLAAQWFLVAINLPQHDGCDPNHPLEHSRNVVGRWPNWLFLNNGFHTAHHDHPSLHWSELPAYHDRYLADRLSEKFCVSSISGLWISWWRMRDV